MIMKIFFFCLIIFIGQPTSLSAAEKNDGEIQTAKRKIQNIKVAFTNREIDRIEVIWLNPTFFTLTTVTPDLLEKYYGRKLIFREPWGLQFEKNMLKAFESVIVGPFADQMSDDVKWGIKFIGREDNRVLFSLYFSSDGKSGAIDEIKYSFKGGGFRWIEGNFSKFFLQFDQ